MSEPITTSSRRDRAPDVGMPAPDIILSATDGQALSLQDCRGNPVVLTFFGDEWDPARAEHIARYNELLHRLPDASGAGKLLRVTPEGAWHQVALTSDPADRVPLLIDSTAGDGVAERYGVVGRQAVFVIDGEGTIRWRFVAPPGVYPMPEAVQAALHEVTDPAAPPAACPGRSALGRREFLATTLAAAFLVALDPFGAREAGAKPTAAPQAATSSAAPGTMPVTLNINGEARTRNLEPRVTLLDALREYIGLTGSKKGCDHGQCGACTVLVEGKRINSCLTLAVMHQNVAITTIEGLAKGEQLHPVQAAFIEHDGFQCGYCTPGQIMSAVGLLGEGTAKNRDDVREQMSGNICRCGAYPNILAAVDAVRTTGRSGDATL